jgi:hypothetical protein
VQNQCMALPLSRQARTERAVSASPSTSFAAASEQSLLHSRASYLGINRSAHVATIAMTPKFKGKNHLSSDFTLSDQNQMED